MFFPTEDRLEAVREVFRSLESSGQPVHQEQLLDILQDRMGRKTAWKCIRTLIDTGAIECTEAEGVRGHTRMICALREWDLMTEEQRQEVIDLLGDIRDEIKVGMVVNVNIQHVDRVIVAKEAERGGDSPGNA